MSIWAAVKTFLAEKFWPWFMEYAWPEIKKYLVEILIHLASAIQEKVKNKVSENSDNQVKDFQQKAAEAERSASETVNQEEIDKLKHEAKVWREASERLSKDNIQLQKDIEEITSNLEKTAIDSLDAMKLDITTDDNKTTLAINGDETYLPRVE